MNRLNPHQLWKYGLIPALICLLLLLTVGAAMAQEDEEEAEDSPLVCLLYQNEAEPSITVYDPIKAHQIELIQGYNLLSDIGSMERLDGTAFDYQSMLVAMDNCTPGGIGDGRINDGPRQIGAPVAIFCGPLGSLSVWDINAITGNGTIAISATGAQINVALNAAAASGTSVVVGSGLGNTLWAAPDDFLAVIGPTLNDADKTYRFNFGAETCG